MRNPRRNTDDVSGGKLSPDLTLDRAVALFMGTHSLSIQQGPSEKQRR